MEITHESLIGSFEQKQKLVSQFNLIHDDFFAVVMQDKPALETTLRTLLKKKDLFLVAVWVCAMAVMLIFNPNTILVILAGLAVGILYLCVLIYRQKKEAKK